MDATNQIYLECSTTHMRVDGTEFDAPQFTLFDPNATDLSFVTEVKFILCLPPKQHDRHNIGFIFYDSDKNPISSFDFPLNPDECQQRTVDDLLLRTVQVPYFIYLSIAGQRAEFICECDSSVYELAHGTLH